MTRAGRRSGLAGDGAGARWAINSEEIVTRRRFFGFLIGWVPSISSSATHQLQPGSDDGVDIKRCQVDGHGRVLVRSYLSLKTNAS